MITPYKKWLKEHLTAAKAHYTEVCKLDDRELAGSGSSAYYEKAHQMFGYIAALEKCLKQASSLDGDKRAKKSVKSARATR